MTIIFHVTDLYKTSRQNHRFAFAQNDEIFRANFTISARARVVKNRTRFRSDNGKIFAFFLNENAAKRSLIYSR